MRCLQQQPSGDCCEGKGIDVEGIKTAPHCTVGVLQCGRQCLYVNMDLWRQLGLGRRRRWRWWWRWLARCQPACHLRAELFALERLFFLRVLKPRGSTHQSHHVPDVREVLHGHVVRCYPCLPQLSSDLGLLTLSPTGQLRTFSQGTPLCWHSSHSTLSLN